MNQKVSIVLPTYNGARYLRGSIESCLRQTHQDLELIVVDDCSTDQTPEILRSFKDPRMIVVRNSENRRLPKSLNIGFARTTGDYLTWTSDDNEYQPQAIEKMLRRLQEEPEAGLVYADYWSADESTGKKEAVRLPDRLDLSRQNDVRGCFLYTRRVYEAVGDYNPHYEIVEDYDYWMRICRRFRAVHCAEPLYLYRYHSGSLTTRFLANQDLFDAILKNRNGHLSLYKTGWKWLYYLKSVRDSGLTEDEKDRLVRRAKSDIFHLSFFYGVCFFMMVGLCRSYQILKGGS